MRLNVKYFTLPQKKETYRRAHSLSEALAKRELGRRGYTVSRGCQLDVFFQHSLFDLHQNSRRVLNALIKEHGIKKVIRIAKYCGKHHGTPDLMVLHAAKGVRFIEVKLGHEAIMPHQLFTMHQLMRWGIDVEVWRYMPQKNVVREKQIGLTLYNATKNKRRSTKTMKQDVKLTKKYVKQLARSGSR